MNADLHRRWRRYKRRIEQRLDKANIAGCERPMLTASNIRYELADGKWAAGDVIGNFGQPGDIPAVGDWNGSGLDSIGVYRNGKWILDTGHHFKEDATNQTRQPGDIGDTPVVGDWNGTGHTEIGVYHNGVLERPDAK